MEFERSREHAYGAERAGHSELRRRRARRGPDGALKEFDSAATGDDVRSVVFHLTSRVDQLTGELNRTRRRVAELETSADEDVLVPVLNRRGLVRELARLIAVIKRYQPVAALVHVDLTELKSINESFGHETGDAVLAGVAKRIRSKVRASDIVGRIGGDKFAVILLSASEDKAIRKADFLAAELSAPMVTDEGLTLSTKVGAGATAIRADDTPVDALDRAAASAERIPE